jgi:hypothetical protein
MVQSFLTPFESGPASSHTHFYVNVPFTLAGALATGNSDNSMIGFAGPYTFWAKSFKGINNGLGSSSVRSRTPFGLFDNDRPSCGDCS